MRFCKIFNFCVNLSDHCEFVKICPNVDLFGLKSKEIRNTLMGPFGAKLISKFAKNAKIEPPYYVRGISSNYTVEGI